MTRAAQAAAPLCAVACVVVLGLAGCEGPPARAKPWRHAPDPEAPLRRDGGRSEIEAQRAALEARRERTLRVRLEAEPTHLNLLVDPEREALWVAFDTVFEALIRYEPPAGGGAPRYAPGLAESWRVVGDGTEIRLILRPGARFHDGRELGAVDVQFTLDWVRSAQSRSPAWRRALEDVITVEKWGPRDVRLTLRRPNAYVLRALAEIPILPQHVYEGDAMAHPKGKPAVGTGPYRVADWTRGRRILLTRTNDYWGEPPKIEEVELVIEPDGAKALVEAKQGEIDVIPALIPEHWPAQTTSPGIADRFAPLELRPPRFRAVVVNSSQPPFDDVRVRVAAARLIDRARIAKEVQLGLARPIAGPVWSGGPGDGEAPEAVPFDPTSAMALLDEAGWRDADRDGIRERGGERLRVTLLATSDTRGDLERDIIVSGWRKAGFVVEVLPGEPAVLMNRLRAHTFHAGLIEWRGFSDDDLAPLVGSRGSLNWGLYSSREVDGVLEALRGVQDPTLRAPRATELGRLLARDMPLLPLTAPDPHGLVHRRVRGVVVRDGWISIRALSLVRE